MYEQNSKKSSMFEDRSQAYLEAAGKAKEWGFCGGVLRVQYSLPPGGLTTIWTAQSAVD